MVMLCCKRLMNKHFYLVLLPADTRMLCNFTYDNWLYIQTPVAGNPYFPPYLASPVVVSTWLTQALYISTGLVFMFKFLSSMMSLTTGASSCLSVFWPRAPLLKLTTILMTVGFPVTISWI